MAGYIVFIVHYLFFFFLMIRRPPISTLTDTLFPYTTLFRSNVELFAPIAQLGMVDVGDMVAIFPEDPVGGQYMARVKVIDRVFDAASGTFGMRLELPNPGNKLPAGLRCRLEINAKPEPRT